MRRTDPLWWALLATAAHAVIFVIPLVIPSLYGAMHRTMLYDVLIYFNYANKAAGGAIPYRDYPVEYPPLALAIMFLPRLFTADFGLYVPLFVSQMLLFDFVALYLVARWVAAHDGASEVPRRLGWFTLFVAALYPLMAARYDMAPTAVAFAAAVWWFSGRAVSGAVAAAAGAFLKVYPGVIAAPALVYEAMNTATSRFRGSVVFLVALAAGTVVSWHLGAASVLRYQVERGLQIETVWAGILMGIGKLSGGALRWEYRHTSAELVAPAAHALAVLSVPIQGVAVLLTLWRFTRTGCRDPIRFAGASVLAFILPGKVLSPQYLIWLIPFVASMGGRTGRMGRFVFLLACVTTTFVFPWMYVRLVAFEPWSVVLLNVRNALLVTLFALMVFRQDEVADMRPLVPVPVGPAGARGSTEPVAP